MHACDDLLRTRRRYQLTRACVELVIAFIGFIVVVVVDGEQTSLVVLER
jgi:hypothetical protein